MIYNMYNMVVRFGIIIFILSSCSQTKSINDRYHLLMGDPGEYSLVDSKGSNGLYPVWEIYYNDDIIYGVVANTKDADESLTGTCDIFRINLRDNKLIRQKFDKFLYEDYQKFAELKKMTLGHRYRLSCN